MQTLIVHSRPPIFFWRDLGPRRAVAATTLDPGGDFWVLSLAGFRDRDNFARSDRRGRRALAMEGTERRLHLHPGAVRVFGRSPASSNRREISTTKSAHGHVSAAPCDYLLVTAATWTAMLDLAFRPHYWAKTAHGRSRQDQAPSSVGRSFQRSIRGLLSATTAAAVQRGPFIPREPAHEWKKCRRKPCVRPRRLQKRGLSKKREN